MTADELFRLSSRLGRCELIAGELIMMSPAGSEHGRTGQRLSWRLSQHVEGAGLGEVFMAETGFIIEHDPDTVRAPDISFVKAARIAAVGLPKAFFPEAPALAVEVVSPDDSTKEVESKVQQWLAAGAELAWVVWPKSRTITVHQPGEDAQTLAEADTLSGEDLIPGFRCRVGDIFAGLPE